MKWVSEGHYIENANQETQLEHTYHRADVQ